MRLIDADALMDWECEKCESDYRQYPDCRECCGVMQRIEDMPTIDAKPVRHGHWIYLGTDIDDLSYGGRLYTPKGICSECSHIYESYRRYDEPIMPDDADFPMWCENCGAKMDAADTDVPTREEGEA